jgi:hypothetical protein
MGASEFDEGSSDRSAKRTPAAKFSMKWSIHPSKETTEARGLLLSEERSGGQLGALLAADPSLPRTKKHFSGQSQIDQCHLLKLNPRRK